MMDYAMMNWTLKSTVLTMGIADSMSRETCEVCRCNIAIMKVLRNQRQDQEDCLAFKNGYHKGRRLMANGICDPCKTQDSKLNIISCQLSVWWWLFQIWTISHISLMLVIVVWTRHQVFVLGKWNIASNPRLVMAFAKTTTKVQKPLFLNSEILSHCIIL